VDLVVVTGPPPASRFDASRPESRVARLLTDEALQRAAGRVDVWQAVDEQVVTPGSRYIDWLLPGLLGMNIMGTGLWSTGFAIVQARTRKLLERLMATPMSRAHYPLSHMLGRLVFLGPGRASPTAVSSRAASDANSGFGPFHHSSSTASNSGRWLRSVARSRKRNARSRSRASVSASAAALAAFTLQVRQSSGIASRWPYLKSTAAVDLGPVRK
jgi:hypothetical protein